MKLSLLVIAVTTLVFSVHAAPVGQHHAWAQEQRYNEARGIAPARAAVALLEPRRAAPVMEDRHPVLEPKDAPTTISAEPDQYIAYNDRRVLHARHGGKGKGRGDRGDAGNAPSPSLDCQPCIGEMCAAICIPFPTGGSPAVEEVVPVSQGNPVAVAGQVAPTGSQAASSAVQAPVSAAAVNPAPTDSAAVPLSSEAAAERH